MSGKNLPGGLITIKDNEDGMLSYLFDKFCIFEKGYGPFLVINKNGTMNESVEVFNYGNTNGVLFYITDGKGNTITVKQDSETGSYTLDFPALTANDNLVTTNLARILQSKTISNGTLLNTISQGNVQMVQDFNQ